MAEQGTRTISQLADDFSVSERNIYAWKKQYGRSTAQTSIPAPGGDLATENVRLRRELEAMTRQRGMHLASSRRRLRTRSAFGAAVFVVPGTPEAPKVVFSGVPELPEMPSVVFSVVPELPEAPKVVFSVVPGLPEVPKVVFSVVPRLPEVPKVVFSVVPRLPEVPKVVFSVVPGLPEVPKVVFSVVPGLPEAL